MAIKVGLGTGVVNILTTDTVIFSPVSIDRYEISAFNIHNTTGVAIIVSVYVSPDSTSASGDKIQQVSVGADASVDINGVIGQGYTTDNIIAVAAAVGLNASLSRTEFTQGD